MKKWVKVLILIFTILVALTILLLLSTNKIYEKIYGEGCCPCSDVYCDDKGICVGPSVCCKCNYSTTTKLMIIINDYIL